MSRSYSSLLFWFALTIAASLMLYHTSDRVNALSQHLGSLNSQIEAEQRSLHILNAEWVYLANPARVDAAARRHLNLQPTAPNRVVAMQNIGSLLPLRDGVEPAIPVDMAEAAPAPTPLQATAMPVAAPVALVKTQPVAPIASIMHAASLKTGPVVAALHTGHINEHMIMPHTAAIEASSDSIGALINSLSLRP
jgi:cell division protein FtsL